jgi:hypothetical protein
MVIWLSILAIVAVAVCAMMLVDRRRGSTGASRGDDLPRAATVARLADPRTADLVF